jgi:hypothetical protein
VTVKVEALAVFEDPVLVAGFFDGDTERDIV